ncbi:MAG: hypothetical protein LBE56_12590 [Tannerella sp.]|nr:hypothetical protein [Tannerella sp.]
MSIDYGFLLSNTVTPVNCPAKLSSIGFLTRPVAGAVAGIRGTKMESQRVDF